MAFDHAHWQRRFDELRAAHRVPGAALAVLVDGELHELATGVLHRGTGVAVTTDSVFQVGSITKIHTATLVMQLAEEGALDLDAPVRDVLPDFEVADPEASKTITARQLLSHTSGLTCDFTHDTGRGDDCLAAYVDAARDVPLDCPPGTAISYSSVGYNVLGRIVEVLTGQTWDAALADRLCAPLGLTHTVTLPEDVLRFRAAMGHLGEAGADPEPAPVWNPLPRSAGPYGGVLCATAGDVLRLARMHLDGGIAADGTRVLREETAAAMRRREVDCPDKWTVDSDGWGLGWTLYDWDGTHGFGHDGATIGQYGFLRVAPEAGVAVVLLTNGGGARRFCSDLLRDLLGELAGIRLPEPFGPPARPVAIGLGDRAGTYRREGVEITVWEHDGLPRLRYAFVDGMAGLAPPIESDLVPVSEAVFAGRADGAFSDDWMPVVFSTLTDGTGCVYVGMRATPKTG
ncbi:serine hydrolase domain-containing protein [Saccharothrix luteola]|uniref:serine hydrolase domain-containing protein n=1 Tax=Saccharothrix luteola TaxID=2893018 RepID=UPI001E29FFCD|nr:serine hydrolase domain-containing protein [Saccharothrix luteola]MCC8242773.1 beta-lactamase family protein [Saccharothrix luteola]